MDSSDVVRLIILFILLLLSGFFSSAETALTTVNKIRMRSLAEDGNKKAKLVLDMTEDSSKMLSTILIGNNIVNLSASSLTTAIAYKMGGSMVALMTAMLTLFVLLFGEITPKTAATINAEKMSLRYAPVIRFVMIVMTPLIWIINGLARVAMFILRIDPNAKNDAMTEDELRTIVDVSHEDGVIESEEKEMIYNVFDLGDAVAKDVMVPKVNVTFAEVDSTYDDLLALFRQDKFTRLPIYQETRDNILGTINMKDLLLFDGNKEEFNIRDIMRDAYFTYEHKNISELLVEMRKASFNIAIVLDEYGATAGLITLEDLLEEIVGEIHDEYDENEEAEQLTAVNDREYIVEGSMSLDDLNDNLRLGLESEDFDSIGGIMIGYLERLPEEGDQFTTENGICLTVQKMDKNRIEKIHILLPEDFSREGDEEE